MSIPLKRFESLDSDFHVGVGDFMSEVNDSLGTLNIADDFISEKNSEMEAAIGQLKKDILEAKAVKDAVMGAANQAISDVTRFTKDLAQDITDMSMIPERYINGMIDDIFGTTDGLGASMRGLVKTCRNQAMSRAGLGRNRFANPRCGGLSMSAGQCSSTGASGILSNATAGVFTRGFNAVNNLIKKILSLAGLGFNANLCNVLGPLLDTAFGAAGSLFDSVASATGVKTLITSSLGSVQALMGNVSAVADVAKNVAGLGVSSFLPSSVRNIVNMSSPSHAAAVRYGSVGNAFYGQFNRNVIAEGRSIRASAQLFDEKVFYSEDDLPSIEIYDTPNSNTFGYRGTDSPCRASSYVDSRNFVYDEEDDIDALAPEPEDYSAWF